MEDMLAAFDNKNPSIKAEVPCSSREALCHTQPTAFEKELVKAYVGGFAQREHRAPHRQARQLKEQKIKEFADKAVIQVKVAAPKKDTKAKPTPSPSGKGDAKPTAGIFNPKPVRRPNSAKVPAKKAPASRAQPSPPREQELSQEEVDAKAEMLYVIYFILLIT
uniref:Uncharacterized protein n=1 Tax=Heliothis virescens TaxID=7102 RepID=A0A2A4JMK1_HELVI